eukprot:851792-Prymnesium_polylepis.1
MPARRAHARPRCILLRARRAGRGALLCSALGGGRDLGDSLPAVRWRRRAADARQLQAGRRLCGRQLRAQRLAERAAHLLDDAAPILVSHREAHEQHVLRHQQALQHALARRLLVGVASVVRPRQHDRRGPRDRAVELQAPAVAHRAHVHGQHGHLGARAGDGQLEELVKVGRHAPLERKPRQERVHQTMALGRAEHARHPRLERRLSAGARGEHRRRLERVEPLQRRSVGRRQVKVAGEQAEEQLPRRQARVDRDARAEEERHVALEEALGEPVDLLLVRRGVRHVCRRLEAPQPPVPVGGEVAEDLAPRRERCAERRLVDGAERDVDRVARGEVGELLQHLDDDLAGVVRAAQVIGREARAEDRQPNQRQSAAEAAALGAALQLFLGDGQELAERLQPIRERQPTAALGEREDGLRVLVLPAILLASLALRLGRPRSGAHGATRDTPAFGSLGNLLR